MNIRHRKKRNIFVETELGNLWTLQSNALKNTVITQRNKKYLITWSLFYLIYMCLCVQNLGYSPLAGCCEQGKKLADFIAGVYFLGSCVAVTFSG
jgi:hypothetical protein